MAYEYKTVSIRHIIGLKYAENLVIWHGWRVIQSDGFGDSVLLERSKASWHN